MDQQDWRRKHFKPLIDRISQGATPHSLRHAFGTIMLEKGFPMRVVTERMGHSPTRISEQV
jgi:site-specific recombinase XerD